MKNDCCSTQLIFANGEFNATGLDNFVKSVKLSECGLSYAVVAIMGPQSSGKSTLLNHLFFTNFTEMDAFRGRNQTTKGIWIARAVGIEPLTLVMDLEGTDGRERGEDDTAFEKQSALFALAVADIVLINIWCHDIGRDHAANKPLLKTVFQVMMRLFSPRRTTLLFVIRDKTKTPLERLELILREDIQKIWDIVSKPESHKNTPLSEFFNVQVTALSSYEEKEEQFKEQVTNLRKLFFNSIAPGGLAGDRRGVVPASAFSYSAHHLWEVIKANRDLDLPAHKVMVATVRCEAIANETLSRLLSDEHWLALEDAVKSGPVSGFGKQLSLVVESRLSEYDMEAMFFDERVRCTKRQELKDKLLQCVYPAYVTLLGHIRSQAKERFKTQLEKSLSRGEGFAASFRACKDSCMLDFDKHCKDAAVRQADWDTSRVREKLTRDIEAYASFIREKKLSEITDCYEKQLSDSLGASVETLLESGRSDTWLSIKMLFERETETTVSAFLASISGFELDEVTSDNMVQRLRTYARSVVEKKAREQAGKVLILMKDKFVSVFNHDEDSMPRVWTGKEDIKRITRDARSKSLRILSAMAAIRLDEKPDNIENILFSSLMDHSTVPSSHDTGVVPMSDPLASSSWSEVSSEYTLITPVQCKSLWRQFKAETEYSVTHALAAQEAYKRSKNILPPSWAIVAMFVLGFNELMMLLRNPLYLLALFVMYLVTKALWIQMDIPAEFRHGTLAGLISISSKFLPTIMNLLRRLAEEAQGHPRSGSRRPPLVVNSYSSRNESMSESSVTGSIPNLSVSSSESTTASSPGLIQRRKSVTIQSS